MSVQYVMIPKSWSQAQIVDWMTANGYSYSSVAGITLNYTVYSQPQYPPDSSYPYTEELENGVRLYTS